ncbi:recombinase family protein [Lysinibacillus sp. FSL W8-0992]|uniref:recombinase family protein n=1 Tax=Lysinibacillus sp. FSL W8-0992 TaxID=2954643 RepID=UPI0030F5F568
MEDKKRVALYSRYSTSSQDGNYSIDIQLERMEAMCASKGWEFAEHFSDPAYSGASLERPDLQRLLSRINDFDVVMVYRLDRLSRSQRDTMTLIQDYFLKNNVAFVSVSETLDTTTPFGMAMIGILAVFAELERATITERMQSGIKKRIEAGYRLLSGNYLPTGYKKGVDSEGNNILVVDEHESKKVHRIFDLYEQYHSITKIQEALKDEGFANRRFLAIRRILSNRLYIGEVQYKEEYFKGVHEPLITEDQFNRVQALLARHPPGKNAGKARESLFSGLITCGCCGELFYTYSYKVKNKVKGDYYVRSYLCRARRFPSEYDEKCFSQIIKNDTLEKLFVNELKIIAANKKTTSVKKERRKNYDLSIKRIGEKINRLIDLYTDGDLDKDMLNLKIGQLNKEKEELLAKQALEAQNDSVRIDFEQLDKMLVDFDKLEFRAKRAIVEKVLSNVIIEEESVIFEWNL